MEARSGRSSRIRASFLGSQLIKLAGAPLGELEWMRALVAFAAASDLLGLGLGLLIGVALQSSSTLAVIAVTLTDSGLLSLEQTVVLLLGGGLGSGVAVALMAVNLGGTARQLTFSGRREGHWDDPLASALLGGALCGPPPVASFERDHWRQRDASRLDLLGGAAWRCAGDAASAPLLGSSRSWRLLHRKKAYRVHVISTNRHWKMPQRRWIWQNERNANCSRGFPPCCQQKEWGLPCLRRCSALAASIG